MSFVLFFGVFLFFFLPISLSFSGRKTEWGSRPAGVGFILQVLPFPLLVAGRLGRARALHDEHRTAGKARVNRLRRKSSRLENKQRQARIKGGNRKGENGSNKKSQEYKTDKAQYNIVRLFLDAPPHLYKRVCPSVHPLFRP